MFQKYRIIKSVDHEGRKVITYIKNNIDKKREEQADVDEKAYERQPKILQMTVKLP